MEKRITTLEVRMDQTACSIDRLDRSIGDLRSDMDQKFMRIEEKMDNKFIQIDHKFIHLEAKIDQKFLHFSTLFDQKFVRLEASIESQRKDCDKKFVWLIGIQTTCLIAALSWMGKIAQAY